MTRSHSVQQHTGLYPPEFIHIFSFIRKSHVKYRKLKPTQFPALWVIQIDNHTAMCHHRQMWEYMHELEQN